MRGTNEAGILLRLQNITTSARIKIPLPENVVFTPNVSERRFFEAQKFCCLFSKSVALR